MHKIIAFLLFAIQVVYMSLKGDYIFYTLTSKQVDKQGSDFQLYSDKTPVFFGEWCSCSDLPWLVPCQQRAGCPCLCQCHMPLDTREKLGVTTVNAQRALRKKPFMLKIPETTEMRKFSSLLMVGSLIGEKNTDKTTAALL